MRSWPTYTLGQAESDFERLTINNITKVSLSPEFMNLRDELINARDEIYDRHNFDAGLNDKYAFDLEFGLELYRILGSDIENRDIYTDDIWRYLAVRVIPDVVHARWGESPDRYYRASRRIYLKQLWWYIHLSWHRDSTATFELLKNNTTDTIQSIVERPGLGYSIELYREIMKQYATYTDGSRHILRRVMVLNTARAKSVAPELVEGGLKGYVEQLFEDVI